MMLVHFAQIPTSLLVPAYTESEREKNQLNFNIKMGGVMLVLLLVSSVLVVFWAWKAFYSTWLKPKKMANYFRNQGINGPPYNFFYGNLKESVQLMTKATSKPMEFSHRITSRILPYEKQMVQTYGKMFVSWHGSTPRVNIMDPDMIRDILSNKFGHFTKVKSNPLAEMLVRGLVSYEAEKWVKHRKIVNPAFHQEKLKRMLPAFYECSNELVSCWEKLVSEEPREVDVWPHLQKLTAEVISRTAFGSCYEEGRRIFELQTEMVEHCIHLRKSLYIPGFRFLPTKRNNRMKEIYREVRSLLTDMIKKREKAMEMGEVSNDDLLSILMDSNFKEMKEGKNSGMSIDEVIEECKLFYFAGQETTSSLLVWTMIILSIHEEWQERAREEILQVFGSKEPDFEGLNHLKIVSMILYEVLRLYPPACMLLRATYKAVELGGIILPPDVQLALPILLVHHDRDLWGEDADEFNPIRFSEGISKATGGQLCYFPFSWGPRICIGQAFALAEAKMGLAMVLQKFSFELSETYVHAPHTNLILKPQYGAQLILRKL